MSTDELAEASGALHEHLDRLEAGQLDPTYDLLLEIADGLGVQPSALVILAEQLDSSTSQ